MLLPDFSGAVDNIVADIGRLRDLQTENTETIQNLQQIYRVLCERRQQQIKKELDSIPKILAFSSNEDNAIGF